MIVVRIEKMDPDSWNSPGPRTVEVAKDVPAALRWIEQEVSKDTYMQGHDPQWWINRGYFRLIETELFE